MTTNRDKYVKGLLKLGATEVVGQSARYRVFAWQGERYYLGPNGAFRSGRSIATSFPVGLKIRRWVNDAAAGEMGLPEC